MPKAVTIIGVGDDGCRGLSSRAMNAVAQAQLLIGGRRHLAFFPEFTGTRIELTKCLGDVLDRLEELSAEDNVCLLASGDPLFFGIGAAVVERLGAAQVEVLPQPSSMQWAFAKLGLKWDDATFISLHGRPRDGFLTRLSRLAKVACFTDAENSPAHLAAYLLEYGQSAWRAWVCENLGGIDERVREFSLPELAAAHDIAALNVLIMVRSDPDWQPPPVIGYLPETEFAKRMPKQGLITKREARLVSLAELQMRPQSVVWDIGAGSGSVSIEAARLAYAGRVYAVESDPQCVEYCRENLRTHAIDNVRIVAGAAPAALGGLEPPDAIFIGGSKGALRAILEISLQRLRDGGRLVVNAVTLESVSETYTVLNALGFPPEVTVLNVSRGVPVGGYLRYEGLNPIHIFAVGRRAAP